MSKVKKYYYQGVDQIFLLQCPFVLVPFNNDLNLYNDRNLNKTAHKSNVAYIRAYFSWDAYLQWKHEFVEWKDENIQYNFRME